MPSWWGATTVRLSGASLIHQSDNSTRGQWQGLPAEFSVPGVRFPATIQGSSARETTLLNPHFTRPRNWQLATSDADAWFTIRIPERALRNRGPARGSNFGAPRNLVRLRRQQDRAVEVRFGAVKSRAVSNRNCVAAMRGGEQRNENDQSVIQVFERTPP